MNQGAPALGLQDAYFQNPIGLAARGQYSSAQDLASMAQVVSAYLEFRQLISTNYVTLTTQDREIELLSTNELPLTYPPATGVTTGAMLDAGPSLAASLGRRRR
jgi:D-alanyl-D-alanine carboxypeptidase (penicillin-binding protein 5/6)